MRLQSSREKMMTSTKVEGELVRGRAQFGEQLEPAGGGGMGMSEKDCFLNTAPPKVPRF